MQQISFIASVLIFRQYLLISVEIDQILHHIVARMLIDDPVHQLEASKGDREENATVFVDV